MRVAVNCPYCKRPMAASSAFTGQMVACPNCRGEFLLTAPGMTPPAHGPPRSDPHAAEAESIHTAATVAAPPAPLPGTTYSMPAPPPQRLELTAPPTAETGVDAGVNRRDHAASAAMAPPLPPQPPPQTARLKTAASAGPTVVPAADGKLPTLQLADADATAERGDGTSKGIPLWLAVGAIMSSTLLSAFLLLGDIEGTQSAAARLSAARRDVREFYGENAARLAPYQVLLREAQQAHSRGDLATERRKYREVLALIRAEGRGEFEGLTGTRKGDDDLEQLLSVLLDES